MTADPGQLGFEFVQERRGGTRQYTLRVHPYLTYWLLAHPDGTAQLSWELALGEYLMSKGLSVSAQDELSLFCFPAKEVEGPLSGEWLAEQVEGVQELLGSVDLRRGT